MKEKPIDDQLKPDTQPDDSTTRREFLRKSVYAAYATPLITALLVENASAKSSQGCTSSGYQPPWCQEDP